MIKHIRITKALGIILLATTLLALITAVPVKAIIYAGSFASYDKHPAPYTWFTRVSTTDVANGDDVGTWYTLPWSFPYHGESKSRVYICSNGFLIFDPTPATTDYTNSPEELKARSMIAPFWDDLRTDVSGGIVSTPGVYVDYVANCIVITWETTRIGAPADSVKFQVVLAPSGIIRVAINSATNFGNFSPTLGVSKGTNADCIDITGEKSTQKTWDFMYDCGCFYYERDGIYYPTQFKCLTSNGFVDEGECHCGPGNSRNFAPDATYWTPTSNTFGTFFAYSQNLYSSAQSWAGKTFCFVVELSLPRAHGSIDAIWTDIPYASVNNPTAEYYFGIESWETDAHTLNPEEMLGGYTDYYVILDVTMNQGYAVENSIAQEYELYDDGFPWYPFASDCGMQIDHFKEYLGSYWTDTVGGERYNCRAPKGIIENSTFLGGGISVTKPLEYNIVYLNTVANVKTQQDLSNYIISRIKATDQLLLKTDTKDSIPVRIAFNNPITPEKYVNWVKSMGIEVSYYNAIGTNNSYGSIKAPAKDMPFNLESSDRMKAQGIEVRGITGFTGYVEADKVKIIQSDSNVLLVDPTEDLAIKQLQQKYNGQSQVIITPPEDLWPIRNLLAK
jgi:hypothetical protein